MRPANRYTYDLLDMDSPTRAPERIWRACRPTAAWRDPATGGIGLLVPFEALQGPLQMQPDPAVPRRNRILLVRAYGGVIVRVTLLTDGLATVPDDATNPMLEWAPDLQQESLFVGQTESAWDVCDDSGKLRFRVTTAEKPIRRWSDLIEAPAESFEASVCPDSSVSVPFLAYDSFFPAQHDSLPLAWVGPEAGTSGGRCAFSLHASNDEKFVGTGERFARMNLAGQTLSLQNEDALGVNNRRCYKNIPFYLSSRGYGLLVLTSAALRLSLGDISTRAAQGIVEEDGLDLFFIGGGTPERILYHYRRLTGFPRPVPRWSFGTWMSRMSYWTAEQVTEVADRMRAEDYPCDVLHLDTGWFDKDWQCDWRFSKAKYPDPPGFFAAMRDKGYRVSLWQLPTVGKETQWYTEAQEQGYVGVRVRRERTDTDGGSNFGAAEPGAATIDFTDPEAVRWYQGLLRDLLAQGAAAIKADFGETIDTEAIYHALPARLLHNRYALLYQKAVFDVTEQVTGTGIIWARSGWVGSQRYPVHWGGDCASTWDGMAGTLRGGLHLGLSGFAFWSHDVPGFHGLPNFMNHWPDDDLFVRWTQFGVFTSHLRFHGAQPREPYEYPAVADLLRDWLRLRYALIPYLETQGERARRTGMPVLGALLLRHPDDPVCWNIDDQFYCGDDLLVAPVMNAAGIRDVYLPEGEWVDLWTGAVSSGPCYHKAVESPLSRLPVFVRRGAVLPVYPDPVACTDQMRPDRIVPLRFDDTYRGLAHSVLGELVPGL